MPNGGCGTTKNHYSRVKDVYDNITYKYFANVCNSPHVCERTCAICFFVASFCYFIEETGSLSMFCPTDL